MSLAITDRFLRITEDSGSGSPSLTENACRVLKARYLKKDEQGKCTESAADLFRRVAKTIADAELLYDANPENRSEWEERFYRVMTSRLFMPNSPTLMNAGREMGMLSACFVLPVRDSINDIFDSIKHTALIQKAGGGTGFAFDELRPTGDYIASSGGTTSGPISFWRAFSEATNAIQQGAFRRGANMGMMYIDHPDILKFLHAKQDLTQFTNYNISVKVTDEWMERFRADDSQRHIVRNPRTGQKFVLPKELDIWGYDIKSLVPVEQATDEDAYYTCADIWNIIIDNAWATGEPGVVFIDKINDANPTPHIGRMEATNPCGEQPLLPYEACNLGSINLSPFVKNPGTPDAVVDWESLRETIHVCTRFLDNVIDANNYPLPEIDEMCKNNRKIGLGVMGFADALFKLGVSYNSDEGVALGERFMQFLNDETHNYSEHLADERGCFPNWEGSTWQTEHNRKMRNACGTTVAPTGTISIIAGCSCGIEPMYSLAFYRNVLKGQDEGKTPMLEVNPIFQETLANRNIHASEGMMDRIATDGTLAGIEELPAELKDIFVCAHDVSPEWHVRMQAGFQKHCDASISKTINFPQSATRDDVEHIYRRSFDLGCKGVTVYRNGCRESQPMALKSSDKKAVETTVVQEPPRIDPNKAVLEPQDLGEICCGIRIRQMTPFGNMHVQITVDPHTERELEVFAQLGKGGDLANSDLEAICRMVSLWLRAGGTLKHVIRQLRGIGSSLQVSTKEGKIMSLGDGLARALHRYQRAKGHFGLHQMLLGKFDLADLDAKPGQTKKNGNGNGSGHESNGGEKKQKISKTAAAKVEANQNRSTAPSCEPQRPKNDHSSQKLINSGHQTEKNESEDWTLARAQSTILPDETNDQREQYKVICPDCRFPLRFVEGCVKCESCGYSRC